MGFGDEDHILMENVYFLKGYEVRKRIKESLNTDGNSED